MRQSLAPFMAAAALTAASGCNIYLHYPAQSSEIQQGKGNDSKASFSRLDKEGKYSACVSDTMAITTQEMITGECSDIAEKCRAIADSMPTIVDEYYKCRYNQSMFDVAGRIGVVENCKNQPSSQQEICEDKGHKRIDQLVYAKKSECDMIRNANPLITTFEECVQQVMSCTGGVEEQRNCTR